MSMYYFSFSSMQKNGKSMGNVGWKVCGPCQPGEVEGSRSRLGHRAERKALSDSSFRKDACQEQPVKLLRYDIS